jgi:Holliday junction resolvase RusA-like endonuclease
MTKHRHDYRTDGPLFPGGLVLGVEIAYTIPTKKRRRWGQYHAIKPDRDNLNKLILDAMEGLVYANDCQAARGVTVKKWGEHPEIRILVTVLGDVVP